MKYGHLFNAGSERPNYGLASPNVGGINSLNESGQINNSHGVSAPSSTDFGTSVNNVNNGSKELSNDYLMKQKLRNSGTYTKLKNKTIYSASSLAHASLNSGIL